MPQISETAITFTPRPDATPEAELGALAAVYKFVLFDSQASKGGPDDLTRNPTTEAEGVSKDKKGQDRNVRC